MTNGGECVESQRVINPERLDEIRAIQRQGATGLLDRIIRLFQEESAELITRLAEAIERGGHEDLLAAAHKFKGISGNVGADGLAGRCFELESRSREGRLDGAAEMLEEIRREHGRVLERLASEPGDPAE